MFMEVGKDTGCYTKEVRSDQFWSWLQNGDLKKRDRKSYSGSLESEYKNISS